MCHNEPVQERCEEGDAETEDLLVEIECLTSQVLRETSLWNLTQCQVMPGQAGAASLQSIRHYH